MSWHNDFKYKPLLNEQILDRMVRMVQQFNRNDLRIKDTILKEISR